MSGGGGCLVTGNWLHGGGHSGRPVRCQSESTFYAHNIIWIIVNHEADHQGQGRRCDGVGRQVRHQEDQCLQPRPEEVG